LSNREQTFVSTRKAADSAFPFRMSAKILDGRSCGGPSTRPLNLIDFGRRRVDRRGAQRTPHVRVRTIGRLCSRAKNDALLKVRASRRDRGDDVLPGPADELDIARSLAEIETHASLIEQAEDRLKQIDDALGRLERALYGMCEDCGEKIPALRLSVLPFATGCVDCQETRNQTHRGAGALLEPSDRRW
jgi:phage/conjugal plasmid C-4 type zinc finger TraR family protein